MKIDNYEQINQLILNKNFDLAIQLMIGQGIHKYKIIEWIWDSYKEFVFYKEELEINQFYIFISQAKYVITNPYNLFRSGRITKHEMILKLIELLEI